MTRVLRRALIGLLLACATLAHAQDPGPVQDPPEASADPAAEGTSDSAVASDAPDTDTAPDADQSGEGADPPAADEDLRGTGADPVWEELAARTEQQLDLADQATVQQLEDRRSQLASWRARFAEARNANSERIQTLEAQIEALKPAVPPEEQEAEGFEEPPDVVRRRQALETQLAELLAPVQVADEAYRRADGLIREIDQIIRQKQARRLLELGPSPLNLLHWPVAVSEIRQIFANIAAERALWSDPERRQQVRDNLPAIILLLLIAVVFVYKGHDWAERAHAALNRYAGHGTSVWSFLVSLFRIILPLIGLIALTSAFVLSGLSGERISQILFAVPIWGLILLGFRWLAERLFSADAEEALIDMSDEQRARARLYVAILSYLFVLRGALRLLAELDPISPETEAVGAFPIVVAIAIFLGFFGRLLQNHSVQVQNDEDENGNRRVLTRFLQTLGTGVVIVSVVAPVMAAVGYAEAGNALLYPTLMTLVLLGLLLVLQRFGADLYGLLTRQGARGRDALGPILIGFVLTLMALPLLALIWGARVADLTELWTEFKAGFTIGDTTISPEDFLTFLFVFAIGYSLTRLVQGVMRGAVLPRTRLDIGGQNALVAGLGYVGVLLAGLIAVTTAGIDLSALAFVAGGLSLGVGFGLQTIVSNFVSGIILLIERPISEGDWIEVGGEMGYVRDISVRATRIETFDRTDVIVPNSDLVSGRVTNYTRGNTVGRLIVTVGVAYGSDTRKVETILREVAEEQPMVLANPAPLIVFDGFGDSALEFQIRVILRDVNWIMNVKSDMNHAIAERFAAEGIEVPFPQRDLWLRNAESLKGDPA
ncbi:DUF3772 domain-containing protein [Sulfitobacter sp. D35]|uniref:DUF3772 domain-containing protein n=1 Tax=Sulfitobacter sp. D35 TaxID=3083252 RepID=UPI00296FB04D|nr:DUF3772 domain-containing protein [Sulfitobacter sp. D35]MDW4496410.1 DUF3772 domain-containing protein [Sulfitobacter sp. D35]